MKKSILQLLIPVTGILIMSYGCSKDKSDPGTGTNEITVNDGEMIIKGTSNYEFTMGMEDCSYLVNYKEKEMGNLNNFEEYSDLLGMWMTYIPSSIMALRSSGWYEGSVINVTYSGTYRFRVTASGDYQIEFHKIPLSTSPVGLPQDYSGAGGTVFGPFSASGTVSFDISCPDAQQAGFMVQLFSATTGEEVLSTGYKPLYVNLDANNNGINNINTTVTKTGLSGSYLVSVETNLYADYTVSIY
jgi:hypothetical protein